MNTQRQTHSTSSLFMRDSDDFLICLFMTDILFCLIYFFSGLKRNEVQAFNPVLNWISSNETTKRFFFFILTNHLFYSILVQIIFIVIVRINKERNRNVN